MCIKQVQNCGLNTRLHKSYSYCNPANAYRLTIFSDAISWRTFYLKDYRLNKSLSQVIFSHPWLREKLGKSIWSKLGWTFGYISKAPVTKLGIGTGIGGPAMPTPIPKKIKGKKGKQIYNFKKNKEIAGPNSNHPKLFDCNNFLVCWIGGSMQ